MPRIRVIDFETTGLKPPAEVIEVGFSDVIGGPGEWSVTDPISWLCGVKDNPPEVRAVHHIQTREVEGFEPFDTPEARQQITGDAPDIYAAHNYDFEAQWLNPIVHGTPVLCTLKAALRVWPQAPSHSNGALRYWLQDQDLINPDHDKTLPPHRAGPDAYVTGHILRALLGVTSARQMVAWTQEPRLFPVCPIGKFRGKPWAEVEAGFLGWMLRQPDMEADLKWNAQREIARRGGGAS